MFYYWFHYTHLGLYHSNAPSSDRQCRSDIMSCNCTDTFYDLYVQIWLTLDEYMMILLCINMWYPDNSIMTS